MSTIQISQTVSVRFNTGLPRTISKLSLIRSLKLLVSEAKYSTCSTPLVKKCF